jgi:phosphoserine phosphatase
MGNIREVHTANELLQMCPGVVLAVDLDGTLVRDDMLRRGVSHILRRAPLSALALAVALLRGGRPELKRAVARQANFDPEKLPYNAAVVAIAQAWRAEGRQVVLATAADASVAQAIASHLGLFDAVHASGQGVNLKGRAKAAFLCRHYGEKGFVYAGDSSADLHVWAKAAGAVLVADSPKLHAELQALEIPVMRLAR